MFRTPHFFLLTLCILDMLVCLTVIPFLIDSQVTSRHEYGFTGNQPPRVRVQSDETDPTKNLDLTLKKTDLNFLKSSDPVYERTSNIDIVVYHKKKFVA